MCRSTCIDAGKPFSAILNKVNVYVCMCVCMVVGYGIK